MTDTPKEKKVEAPKVDKLKIIHMEICKQAIEEFKGRYPNTYKQYLKIKESDVFDFVVEKLREDAQYEALLKRTKDETDIAAIIGVAVKYVIPLITRLAF